MLLYKILIHDSRFQCDISSVLPIGKNIEKKITEHNKTKKIETDDKMTSPKLTERCATSSKGATISS